MTFLVTIHAIWRWAVLIAAVLALVGAAQVGRDGQKAPGWSKQAGLVFSITLDIQVLVGLLIWVGRGWWAGNAFFAFIHPVAMLLALGLAHMGRGREKRALAAGLPPKGSLFAYGGALALILLAIPWFV
jgi:hypothetical protein